MDDRACRKQFPKEPPTAHGCGCASLDKVNTSAEAGADGDVTVPVDDGVLRDGLR